MNTIAIIGTGISGLSLANMLVEKGFDVIIFEKKDVNGGLISCKNVNGNLFHKVGGHVFNSKDAKVKKWFKQYFDLDKDFLLAERYASIFLDDPKVSTEPFLSYPIENSLYSFKPNILKQIVDELLHIYSSSPNTCSNFSEFLLSNFGSKLSEIYFHPYNKKIWAYDLSCIPLEWLSGKLPMPSIEDIFTMNISRQSESNMVHSTFYYPKIGGSQFIIDTLSDGLNIKKQDIETIEFLSNTKKLTLNNSSLLFDSVVYTGDIRKLASICVNIPEPPSSNDVKKLASNGTISILCSCKSNPYSWVYLPNENTPFHRIIMTGNFSETNNSISLKNERITCTVEATFSSSLFSQINIKDYTSYLANLPFDLEYIDHHISPLSYIIHDQKTHLSVQSFCKHYAKYGIFCHGRSAQWQYYNMDACILESFEKLNLLMEPLHSNV